MFYVVSFDGCGLESPLQSRTAASALALAEEAVRNGCRNVVIQVPGGPPLTVSQFAELYCSDSPAARSAPSAAGAEARRSRRKLREQHAAEVEASQGALRESIAATEKLVDDSDRMLRRHRKECDDEDEGKSSG